MYILCFHERRRRVFGDKIFEIHPSVLEVESRDTGVRVANRGEWKRDVDGEVIIT